MPLWTVDEFVQRVQDGYYQIDPIFREWRVATTAVHSTSNGNGPLMWSYTVPAMPSGVTAFIPARLEILAERGYFVLAQAISLGTLNIGTNVFTDGAQMPTVTELGASRQISGALWVEVDTELNATPGTLTVTYEDQDVHAPEVSPAVTLTASAVAGSGAFLPLNTGDVGVTDLTAAARAAGTTPSGVLHFYGLIPIGQVNGLAGGTTWCPVIQDYLGLDLNPVRLVEGDNLRLLQLVSNAQHAAYAQLMMVGDS